MIDENLSQESRLSATTRPGVRFVDAVGAAAQRIEDTIWPPLLIKKDTLQAEIDRLSAVSKPVDGRRRSLIVHPLATEPGLGLAPGIQVAVEVLLPGERTAPIRHNSSVVNFCIEGAGKAIVGGTHFDFHRFDVWYAPALNTYVNINDTDARQVRLSYSNAALLEKLKVHFVDEHPPEAPSISTRSAGSEPKTPRLPEVRLDVNGALLLPYEQLINPAVIEQCPLHWPWLDVKAELDKLTALGASYRGRRLYLLYNPATGRTNGTTNNFFATMTVRPPAIIDRPHRHASAAINYFFGGSGWSRIAGQRYEWSAGDLMLTAPGWAIHHHASDEDDPVYELTIQDSPLHLSMDSLMWQEDMKDAPRLLGSQPGFDTNAAEVR
jgi:gentisate 1,2-dioxygenase